MKMLKARIYYDDSKHKEDQVVNNLKYLLKQSSTPPEMITTGGITIAELQFEEKFG